MPKGQYEAISAVSELSAGCLTGVFTGAASGVVTFFATSRGLDFPTLAAIPVSIITGVCAMYFITWGFFNRNDLRQFVPSFSRKKSPEQLGKPQP